MFRYYFPADPRKKVLYELGAALPIIITFILIFFVYLIYNFVKYIIKYLFIQFKIDKYIKKNNKNKIFNYFLIDTFY
jgi:hypothetical protein